jgi:hypothetical protein
MSRGPGRIEQALVRIFFGPKLDNAFTTEELCEQIYPGALLTKKIPTWKNGRPAPPVLMKYVHKKHRVAIIRAATQLSKRPGYEDLHSWRGENLGRTHIWFNRANVMSYAMAALKAENYHSYRSRDERRNWNWWRLKPGDKTEEHQLRAMLAPGGQNHKHVVSGGAYHRHVQEWITERDLRRAGDKEKLAAFLADQEAADEARLQKLVEEFKAVAP